MRHPQLKRLVIYGRLLKFECDRILRHSCCIQCAIETYRSWSAFRDRVLAPALRGEEVHYETINYANILQMIEEKRDKADHIDRSRPGINGWLIEGLAIRYPNDWMSIAAALGQSMPVRPPQEQDQVPLPQPLVTIEVSGPKEAQ
jgi:hypothetical protein